MASNKPDPKKESQGSAPRQPQLQLPPDLRTVYVNLVRISHTPSEMVFDFARMLPGESRATVLSRVLMSPMSAKLFHRALSENLAKYEAAYGEIEIPKKSSLADYLFRQPPNPPDNPPESPSEE